MLAAVGAAVGFGCDLCSHVKPVSRGVGCGGFNEAEGRPVEEMVGVDGAVGTGTGAFGAGGAQGTPPSFPREGEGRRT